MGNPDAIRELIRSPGVRLLAVLLFRLVPALYGSAETTHSRYLSTGYVKQGDVGKAGSSEMLICQ